MFSLNVKILLALIGLLLLVISVAAAKSRKTSRLTGMWGGVHIRLNVEQGSATIDYDCANGTITGPLTIDRNGRFSWRGFHNPERGGPIRVDVPSPHHAATYTGSIKGDTMTLTLKVANKEAVDTFTLKRGAFGKVFKCK